MEERKLDAAESLALIGRMIENTRNRMVRNAGRPYLVWGYTTVVFTLLVWAAVLHFGDPRWNWLWFGLPVTGSLGMYLTRPRDAKGSVRTFVDGVIDQVWMVIGLAAFLTATLSMLAVVRPPMLFLIVLLMSIGTALTGLVTRFIPSIVGGFIGLLLAPVLLAVTRTTPSVLLFIAAFVVMMIVPGHILNYQSNHTR
ncbi:hypothetical protein [Alistipes sp.]|uniref:hypothetical protein n=1 Tax=Alistipes sp. TaxID=1872444 RepID=UPI003AEF2232